MRARQPRKHMSHMGSTQKITLTPELARKVLNVKTDPRLRHVQSMLNEAKAANTAKAATAKKYWLIGGGITLAAIVGGVLIYKSRNKG